MSGGALGCSAGRQQRLLDLDRLQKNAKCVAHQVARTDAAPWCGTRCDARAPRDEGVVGVIASVVDLVTGAARIMPYSRVRSGWRGMLVPTRVQVKTLL